MTYAGEYGRDEVGPVGWDPHREWALAREAHLLGLRRAEITKIAVEDVPASHLRWALGVAAGAVLVAGTFVATSLSGTSEVANSAGSVPEHVFAPLEQGLVVTEPQADAPAPEPAPAPAPVNAQPQQETTPASTEQRADTATQDTARGSGENQRTAPSANTSVPTPPPAPAPAPPQNQHGSSGGQWGQGSQPGGQWGGHGGQWGSGSQWGHGNQHRSPGSGFGAPTMSSYSAAKSTPTGPAMSMLNPVCDSTGR